jgi:hypothetical protein
MPSRAKAREPHRQLCAIHAEQIPARRCCPLPVLADGQQDPPEQWKQAQSISLFGYACPPLTGDAIGVEVVERSAASTACDICVMLFAAR